MIAYHIPVMPDGGSGLSLPRRAMVKFLSSLIDEREHDVEGNTILIKDVFRNSRAVVGKIAAEHSSEVKYFSPLSV